MPAIAIAKQEPTPSNKIMEPSTSSPMLSFAFKYGTKPAHKAVYMPGIKKAPKAPRIFAVEIELDRSLHPFWLLEPSGEERPFLSAAG